MAVTRRSASKANCPDGPQTPCDLERLDNKLERLQTLWQQYGDCYRLRAESRTADAYVINHPDWVKRVLLSNHGNYRKGVGIERVRVLLGNGLMVSEGGHWRTQRRMLQPAFQKANIESFFVHYHQQAKRLAGRCLASARRDERVNMTEAVSEATLLALLQSLFSEDLLPMQQEQGNPFQIVSDDSRRDLQFAMKFRAGGKLVQQVMDRRRRENRFPADLLTHCLLSRDTGSGAAMSDKQVIDEILTLIVAGHETTAASLNWVWYLLALHPEVYERVTQEARALALHAVPDWPVLESMQWIPRVIKEALRLYPPGWLYTRRAVADDCLGDYRIPAGSDVFICSYLLHRHPSFWEKPEQFLPERFSPERQAGRHRFAYIPFSAGPRHCIGESFAMAEMMIHVAVLAASVRPQLDGPQAVEIETEINLRPRHPLYLRLKPTR